MIRVNGARLRAADEVGIILGSRRDIKMSDLEE